MSSDGDNMEMPVVVRVPDDEEVELELEDEEAEPEVQQQPQEEKPEPEDGKEEEQLQQEQPGEPRESAAGGGEEAEEQEEMADAPAIPAEAAAAAEEAVVDESEEKKEDEVIELEDDEDDGDDDIYIIDEAEEEEEEVYDPDGPAIDEGVLETLRENKALAEKFFDPESPTHVAKLAPATRQNMAKFAAAMNEWFCCLPSPDMLDVVPAFADIEVPFPVTPEIKRALVRRDLGPRLIDFWRQTKDPEKLAKHFKIRPSIAVLSLLDYGFANHSYELDIVPLIKWQYIDKTDYWRVAAFILENCEPAFWKEPEDLIIDTLNTPICASVMLYLMATECMRGTSLPIPWKETEKNVESLSPEVRASLDEAIKEALKELHETRSAKHKQRMKEMDDMIRQLEKENFDLNVMGAKLKSQISADVKAIQELEAKHFGVKEERRARIARIRPKNFEEHGIRLAQMDEEIVVTETRRGSAQFTNNYLLKTDLEVEKGARVLARRKEDASEKFEEATFVEMEASDADRALVEFASDQGNPISLPLRSIAIHAPFKPKMPAMAEGIRVVALVRHPLHSRDPPAFYSGTIFSRYDLRTEEYAVAFDDFFDEYINVNNMFLMLAQSFAEREGQPPKMDRRHSYLLVTPNESAPEQSTERMVFMLFFLAKFPDWALVRMPDKRGTNVATIHRDGRSCVARTLKVDRQMVWLRFDPVQVGFDSEERQCLAFPCRDATHSHHDEKMYRGSTRLKQQRQNCGFDKTMEAYRAVSDKTQPKDLHQMVMAKMTEKVATRHELRRMQRMNHGLFEPAVPAESKREGEKAKMTQTARKRGTGLMEMEPAVSSSRRSIKRELKKIIKHHIVDPIDYSAVPLHSPCSHECLKGKDADAMDDRFTHDSISPYFIPIMCGWRRIKNGMKWSSVTEQQYTTIDGCIFYRAPCGRPLKNMEEIADYLRETHSELTVDLFSFSFFLDETAYVWVDPKFIKMDDIASGAEGRAIPVVNFIDNESPPSFIYRQRRYPLNKKMADTMGMTTTNQFCSGCDCTDDCSDWTKCACQRLTHRESVRTKHSFNHVTKGYINRLLHERVGSGLYECNENCGCSRKRCINRVVQNELKIPMQMVKTYAMGWGVRTLVDIPQGTFISCYHGAVLSDDIGEVYGEGDEYYADLDFYDLAETEKGNAGVDVVDQGVFFEDVGLRDLTPEEIRVVEMTDELKKIHRLQEATLRKRKQLDAVAARQERKRKREQKLLEERLERERAALERMKGGADKEEDKTAEKEKEVKKEVKEGEEQKEEEKKEEGPKEGEGMIVVKKEIEEEILKREEEEEKELDELKEMVEKKEVKKEMEEEEGKEEKEEDEDEEEQAGEEDDDEVDEGVEEGGSDSEEEEEAQSPTVTNSPTPSSPSPSADEEKKGEREDSKEYRFLRQSERRMEMQRKKEEKERQMQKMKKEREEAAKRWTIPVHGEKGQNQYGQYFEEADTDYLFLLDAKTGGNIGRQYNHSCDPNMYTQHIFVDTHDIRLPWVAFFAKRDIKAGEELLWDYGWIPNADNPRGLKCMCGVERCRIDLL